MAGALLISNREPLAAAFESATAQVGAEITVLRRFPKDLPAAKVVIISWMGSSHEEELQNFKEKLEKSDLAFAIFFTQARQRPCFARMTQAEVKTAEEYLLYGGSKNMLGLLTWLKNVFCGFSGEVVLPQKESWQGIYRPEYEEALSKEDFEKTYASNGKKRIALLFPREAWVWRNLDLQDRLIEAIEKEGALAMPVFTHWAKDDIIKIPGPEEAIAEYLHSDGRPSVDAVINLLWFSLSVGRNLANPKMLQDLNVPVLQGQTLISEMNDWQADPAGLNPVELNANVVMPEFDGVIHGVPVAWRKKTAQGELRWQPIEDGIRRLAARAVKWAALRDKKNSEKKIAIMLHNYPPGNSSIGTAIALDAPASVEKLLRRMAQEGYDVGTLPSDDGWLIRELTAGLTNERDFCKESVSKNATRWPEKAAKEYFAAMPEAVCRSLAEHWGEAPGEIMTESGATLIPGRIRGKVFIGVQPPRGFGEAPEKAYHSPDLPPPYNYLAYYQWLRDSFRADAVIHVGTHGSLEWLPGKSCGLSKVCYPEIALAELPNIYPYLITVVCEGLQAKRRSAAVLVSHLPAPTTRFEMYGPLAELERLLDEAGYIASEKNTEKEVMNQLISEKMQEADLDKQLPRLSAESEAEYRERVHAYLYGFKTADVRCGLHILGRIPEKETLEQYLAALSKVDNGEVPALPQTIASLLDHDYLLLVKNCSAENVAALNEIEKLGSSVLKCIIELREAGISEICSWQWRNEQALPQLQTICGWLCREALPALLQTASEEENILKALSGFYIAPGPAGAPTSGMADVLPTGRNFYGVDPRAVPSPLAWEMGRLLTEALLERHVAETGSYPENIGMIMWSGSNMRSRGQCVAQFLWLLGIEPLWQGSSGRICGLRVMPLAELGRPRIDVTVRASGMFRDSMPPVMALLDSAVELAAAQPETTEENYLRKHVLAECDRLEKAGKENDEAWEEACYRIFSCRPGTYGAGVGAVIENRNWQDVDDLARVYVEWGGYAYTRKRQGCFAPEAFSGRLATLDVTIKNEDNNEINMLDSDDFNAFHGGMIAAVRSLSGRAPKSYCGDSSDRNKIEVRTLQEELQRLYRSQVLNPQFIAGMKKHGYKGAADMACVISQSFAWSASSDIMDDWMYEAAARQYALQPETASWLKETNPWALRRIAEKLLEAEQRGLWQAKEETKQALQKLYLDIEGELEDDQ